MSDYILTYLKRRIGRLGLEPRTPEVRARIDELQNLALIVGNYSDLSAEGHVGRHAGLEKIIELNEAG